MPRNPLDILKSLALKNVPQATPEQEENRDFRAQAIQDTEPAWKKAGRGAMESLTGFFTDDPFAEPSESVQKGITKPSVGAGLGSLAAAAPFSPGSVKRLPAIAPEAYRDVKAGGLKLYSRLTDAFAKAPKQMHPQKARSVASQGAAKEEIDLRKLEQFLSGRDPNTKITRDEIMEHLAANPLELNVVRKGAQPKGHIIEAQSAMDQFQHRMDTEQGAHNWIEILNNPNNPQNYEGWSDDAVGEFRELQARLNNAPETDLEGVRYDWLQTPGPKENYGETLITMPVGPMNQKADALKAQRSNLYGGPNNPQHQPIQDELNVVAPQREPIFQSTHWDEPNVLVHSRYNDRRLNPSSTDTEERPWQVPLEEQDGFPTEAVDVASGGSKGRFTEEIQSDLHQQGREKGYKGDPMPEWDTRYAGPEDYRTYVAGDTGSIEAGNYSGQGPSRDYSIRRAEHVLNEDRVPDAPFKETYPDLSMKVDLLDWANDPESEWFGIADADTVSAMEGHPTVKAGTEHYYNKRHPSALEKLLNPLGGEVEPANLPSPGPVQKIGPVGWTEVPHRPSIGINAENPQGSGSVHIATALTNNMEEAKALAKEIAGRNPQWPGPGFWKASGPNKSADLKALIRERGFPAMAVLLALQESMKNREQ